MQKQRLFVEHLDHAEASAGSSQPQSSSPLYPKTKALGFTGLSDKRISRRAVDSTAYFLLPIVSRLYCLRRRKHRAFGD